VDERGFRGKSNEITARESGPALAMGSSDIFRIALLRTAAASNMTAHTALHASQANAHANKADDTSPFSQLLESTAPKPDKTKPKDKSASDDSRADETKDTEVKNTDVRNADSKIDGKTDAKADATAQADKSDKTDKDADKPAEADAAQVAADAPVQPPAVSPAPVAVATAAVPGATNNDIEAVTGAAPAPQTDKTEKPAPQDDAQADDAAADAGATPDIKGVAKPAPRKPLQAADAKAGKPDDIKTDGAKADSAKPDASQPVAANAPAPKPVQAAGTNMAVHDITAPQAPQTNTPSVTQHVQVAPQAQAPAPNMPALAIEISAKSQSGAKQFDIRLDPPELGRVEVRLSIDAAGKASAHLSADQPQTLDLLQKDSTSLMRALRDAGLDVSQDGLNFSLRQQSQDSGAHQGGSRGTPRNFSLTATTSNEATATSAAFSRPADGRVDISV
jgi:flagellar hook-length control protein FliK